MKPLDVTSWHYKLYVYMSQSLAGWSGKEDFHTYPKHYGKNIGLCPYMRMILLWGPISLLSNLFPLAAIGIAFLVLPAGINGPAGVIWIFVVIAVTLASVFIIAKISDWLAERQERHDMKGQIEKQHSDYEAPITFWSLFKEWLAARKTKLCIILELPDD